FLVFAVAAAVLTGLERDETPESLRRLTERASVWYDEDFTSSSQLRYASGALRAAAGNHEAAIEELRWFEGAPRAYGGENPALVPWRSAAALSLAELDRHEEARGPAAREVPGGGGVPRGGRVGGSPSPGAARSASPAAPGRWSGRRISGWRAWSRRRRCSPAHRRVSSMRGRWSTWGRPCGRRASARP